MTEAERQLSLYMMRTWAAVAKSGGERLKLPDASDWLPLGANGPSKDSVGGIHLLAIGEAPQAPNKPPAIASDQPIRVFQTELAHHAFAQQRPVGSASLQDRVRFWMHDPIGASAPPSNTEVDAASGKVRICRYLQNYYGFLSTPPRFLPWS